MLRTFQKHKEYTVIYYPLQSNNIILNPLFEDDAFHQLKVLCNNQEFIQNSRVFTNELNLSDSNFMIEKLRLVEGYWFHNRLFSIVDKKTNKPTGIAGLKNIDWIEHRAEIVLIMDNDSIKSKLSYEPIKVMCKKAFQPVDQDFFKRFLYKNSAKRFRLFHRRENAGRNIYGWGIY